MSFPIPDAVAPAGVQRRSAMRGLGRAALALLVSQAPAARAGPGPEATPRLARGFNLAHWFEYERNQPLTGPELAGLRRIGLDHVRIPLDPLSCGWSVQAPEALPFLPELSHAVGLANQAGLVAVVDLHLRPEHKDKVEKDRALESVVVRLWRTLAGHFAALPPGAVAFELFNEPQYYGAEGARWVALQRQLLAAVRLRDREHLVLLSGNRGGSLDGLLGLWPEPDARAAYTFHYYDPFVFTHQALPWLDERYTAAGTRRGVRYPASLNRATPPVVARRTALGDQEWADFMAQDWGATRIRQDMDRAGAWARARGVRVLCNEFGCIRAQVEPESRYRWMADVRQALEANGLGWTVWEYAHIFGLTAQSTQTGQAGQRVLDGLAVGALGLQAQVAGT